MTTVIPLRTWKRDRVPPNETTHYIYANVTSWQYTCDQINPRESECRPTTRLHLDAVTDQSSIIQEAMPLGLSIICKDEDCSGIAALSPWQLDLIPALDDPPIPRYLEAVIPLEEKPFLDLKECLFITAQSPEASILVILTIQDKTTALSDDVAERSFAIVEFGYTLNHQKECS